MSDKPTFRFDNHLGSGTITTKNFTLMYSGRISVNYDDDSKTMIIMWVPEPQSSNQKVNNNG